MSAVLKPLEAQFEAMTPAWLAAVARLERSAYDHPWSEVNFADSINAGYRAQLLTAGLAPDAVLLGYFVAMKGLDEVHLLNITVAPAHQRQGWACVMLDALALWSRGQGARWLWLEVRVGNTRAKSIYERYGFRQMGVRRNYYPATAAGREDAIVMSFPL
ncbi:ribosomal protein S18-alanine N-acetyltransferase [Polaromonas sp.]|uniref:ribosomal protein S18-alanine N-acetyltransferase n=1 Tax=Polaromonas sp. TaxID=1869339 RepID=UPI0017DE78D4|nr:ribosomal protein S18-alanine N-acetyltransferase [Polaromonas sp.]NMM07658.1 ribosomal protein S18-alanine N-acetyltransferase [Polaromonas sp.]